MVGVIMLNVVMLNVVMLNVVMMNVVMLYVMAPKFKPKGGSSEKVNKRQFWKMKMYATVIVFGNF